MCFIMAFSRMYIMYLHHIYPHCSLSSFSFPLSPFFPICIVPGHVQTSSLTIALSSWFSPDHACLHFNDKYIPLLSLVCLSL